MGAFCCRTVLLPASPCWSQWMYSDHREDARVLLSGVICTVSVPLTTDHSWEGKFHLPVHNCIKLHEGFLIEKACMGSQTWHDRRVCICSQHTSQRLYSYININLEEFIYSEVIYCGQSWPDENHWQHKFHCLHHCIASVINNAKQCWEISDINTRKSKHFRPCRSSMIQSCHILVRTWSRLWHPRDSCVCPVTPTQTFNASM